MNLYTIFDKVAEESGPIYEAINDGVARRNYVNTMRNTPSHLRGDYALFRLGSYDSKNMSVEALKMPLEIDLDLDFELLRIENENKVEADRLSLAEVEHE